jgi:LPS sulfotransferase NodH
MTDIRRSYLVCATQRSGSTLLCELLKGTGVAGHPEEFFEAMRDTGVPPHPGDFLRGLAATGLGVRDDPKPTDAPAYSSLAGLADYREHLERTFTMGTTPNGVFGAKLMFNQLDELHALAGRLPELAGLEIEVLLERLFGQPRYIWISRRDVVRQAVSMWKALQSRRWRADDGNGDDDGGDGLDGPDGDDDESVAPHYRFDAIDHLVRRFQAEERGWQSFFSRHGVEPLAIAYEDELVVDRDGTIRRALEWLGVSPPPGWHAEEPMRRQSGSSSDDWVAAYHRDRHAAQHSVPQLS